MTLEEYKSEGRARYAAMVEAIRAILKAAVNAQNMAPHLIAGRAKDPTSLAKKLADRGIDPERPIDEELKDLAGVRIVFLTNTEVDGFNHAGILHDNFDVLDVNVHHPVPGTDSETRLFDSTNYLVVLKPDRLALPEYMQFEGLRAEVQVQTLLNHAWAEMGHDTIYKQPRFEHVGEKRLSEIKERMDKVMREHLLPAGHDFDKIARDFHQLMTADQSFEGAVETLTSSKDNQALGEAVGTLDDLVLTQVDEPQALFLKALPLLVDAVERTRGTPAGQVETPFGKYEGKGGVDIARLISRVILDWRYADPTETFGALVRLYAGATSDPERKIWIDLATEFSSHNLDVWKRHGPAIPRLILEGIGKLGACEVAGARGILLAMLAKILSPEVAGLTSTSATVTIHQATVAADAAVGRLRSDALAILERFLDASADDGERNAVLKALREAGRPPFRGGDGDLMAMVIGDAARVIRIERARLGTMGLELRRKVEVDALRWHNSYHVVPPYLAEHAGAVAAQESFAAELQALRDELAADSDLQRYKALVGYDSVRPDAWQEAPFDLAATAKWREAIFPAMVDEITDETVSEWITRFGSYVAEPKDGGDHLRPLAEFCRLLAARNPGIVVAFFEAMDDSLSQLLIALLRGLDEAGERDLIRRYVARWMGEGRFLRLIGNYLRWQDDFAVDMLETLGARAIELGDAPGVVASMSAAERQFENHADQRLIDKVFMPGVGFVTDQGDPYWVLHEGGFHAGALVEALDEAELQRLLNSFIALDEIDYVAETVLALVAGRLPGIVLDFFEARTKRDGEGSGWRFSPIPFGLHMLHEPLSAHPELLVATARRWYARDSVFHEYQGGRLVHNVFPTLDAIADTLAGMVRGGEHEDIGFVLATLVAYDGAEHIYPLCMDIVDVLEPGDALLKRVAQVLGRTGVLTGEFGYVEAGGQQRERLDRFRDDPRPKVQAFVRELQRKIDQSMAWEQRRAERDVEQRRRDWGEA